MPRLVVRDTLLVAAAYFVAARLGLLLALPPGYATAVWPASGIALAAVLLRGWRVLPGVFLGSLLANVWTHAVESRMDSALIAAGIAAGAALQAAAGRHLIRRFVRGADDLADSGSVVRFLLLGGPVGCLIGATVGTSVLLISGAVDAAGYAFHWWTWWVGDTIGVLVFTPILLAWGRRPNAVWRRRRLAVSLPLAASFALVVAFFVYASGWEQSRIRVEFERRSDAIAHALAATLRERIEVLRSIESHHAAEGRITRDAFRRFVARPLSARRSLSALSWNAHVAHAERLAFEQARRREGLSGYEIRERTADGRLVPAPPRDAYVPITYIEPLAGNEAALGFDVASDPARRDATSRARESGRPMATAPVQLVQGGEDGMLVVVPVYGGGGETAPGTRAPLAGFAVGIFQLRPLVEQALFGLDRAGIDVEITDLDGLRTVYASTERRETAGLSAARSIDVAGRTWRMRVHLPTRYLVAHAEWQAWSLLAAGLVFVSLLGGFLLLLTGRAAEIEELVASRTVELQAAHDQLEHNLRILDRAERERRSMEQSLHALMDHTPAMVYIKDHEGRYLLANRACERHFRAPVESIRGKTDYDFFPAEMVDPWRANDLWVLEAGAPLTTEEVVGQDDGPHTYLSVKFPLGTASIPNTVCGISTDVTELKRAADALRESEEHFRAVAETSQEAILTADERGNIHYGNHTAFAMFGYEPHELLDQPLTTIMPERFHALHRAGFAHFQQTGRGNVLGTTVELVGRRKDGREFPLELSLAGWSSGGRRFATGIMRDITQRKRTEDALRRSNQELEQFAYVASHDLKEPLRMIQSFAKILATESGDLDPQGQEALHYLLEGATRMQSLIDDLLMYSRLSSRPREFVPVDCDALLQEVCTDLRPLIAETKAVIRSQELPRVQGQATQLRQLFQNLIGNALKFRGTAPPSVEIAAERRGAEWLFSVKDNGIGMGQEHLERVFLMFQRLHPRTDYPGTGIGLAVCKKVVDRHGGRIWAESEPGGGSTFWFTIPVADAEVA